MYRISLPALISIQNSNRPVLKNSVKVTQVSGEIKIRTLLNGRISRKHDVYLQGYTERNVYVCMYPLYSPSFPKRTVHLYITTRAQSPRGHAVETLSRILYRSIPTRCISAHNARRTECSLARLIQFTTAVSHSGTRSCMCSTETECGYGRARARESWNSSWNPVSRLCCRGRKFRIGQPDDGLPRRHGRRGWCSHPRQLEPRKRDVASAQREPTGTLLAGRDEAPSASPCATPHPSSPAHARASSTATATPAASRGLHAAVFLVPGGSQSRITHVSVAFYQIDIRIRRNPWKFNDQREISWT